MLDSHVLVLNRLWQAINICTARRALCLLYMGEAQVVTENGGAFNTFGFEEWKDFSQNATEEDELVGTVSFKIRIPRIILLLFYDRLPSNEVKFTRKNIYERDGNRCQYCGKKFPTRELNLDHVVPLGRAGPTTWTNVVCSCIRCNARKGNRTLREVGMRLIRKPKKPRWHPFIKVSFSTRTHESWKHFLDIAYWNVQLGED